MPGFDRYSALPRRLGPHKTGKCCLYLKGLADVDVPVLRELIDRSVAQVRRSPPGAVAVEGLRLSLDPLVRVGDMRSSAPGRPGAESSSGVESRPIV